MTPVGYLSNHSYVPIHGNTVPKLFESVRYYLQFFSERQPFDRFGLFTRTEEVEADENEKMLTMAQSLVTRLRENGVNDLVIEEIFHPTQQLSRLHVRFSRILLPDYQNMEIKMSPLPKAVFLLYLKHPEGIRFCDLPDYREELYHIYASFSGRDDANDIRASIDDVTNPLSNSINEKCSRIRHAFLSKFEEKLARTTISQAIEEQQKKLSCHENWSHGKNDLTHFFWDDSLQPCRDFENLASGLNFAS